MRDHCGAVLSDSNASNDISSVNLWIAAALEDLVLRLPMLDGIATAEKFVGFLHFAITEIAQGNRSEFCRMLGLPRWSLTRWLGENERPTLPQLLSVCYGLNCSPSLVFLEDSADLISRLNGNVRPVPEIILARQPRPMLSDEQRHQLTYRLREIMADEFDCRPLVDIAATLNLTSSTLKYWFPEECTTIIGKHKKATAQLAAKKLEEAENRVSEVVRNIRTQGQYPSRRRVNQLLQKHRILLTRTELISAYRNALRTTCD